MHIHALVTREIMERTRPIRYVSYSRDADDPTSVFVMVAHAATWELRGMTRVLWTEFTNQFPETASLQFAIGDHLLELQSDGSTWTLVNQ